MSCLVLYLLFLGYNLHVLLFLNKTARAGTGAAVVMLAWMRCGRTGERTTQMPPVVSSARTWLAKFQLVWCNTWYLSTTLTWFTLWKISVSMIKSKLLTIFGLKFCICNVRLAVSHLQMKTAFRSTYNARATASYRRLLYGASRNSSDLWYQTTVYCVSWKILLMGTCIQCPWSARSLERTLTLVPSRLR